MFDVSSRFFQSEKQIKLAMKFFAKELNVCHKPIHFTPIHMIFAPLGGAAPLFGYDDHNQIKLKNFHLFLNMINVSSQSAIQILAHEMIHIQQMQTKRLDYQVPHGSHLEATFLGTVGLLQPNQPPIVLWEGQDWSLAFRESKNCRDTYYSLPWEKEAFDMQDELANTLTYIQLCEIEEAGQHEQDFR